MSETLFSHGALGLQEDHLPGEAPPVRQPWDTEPPPPPSRHVLLRAWWAIEAAGPPLEEALAAALPLDKFEWQGVAEEGWADAWRARCKPVESAKDLRVAPPWLAAADLVLTTGCTTGVEAMLMGTPAVSLIAQPQDLKIPGYLLSNHTNVVCATVGDAVSLVTRHWDGEIDLLSMNYEERLRVLEKNILIEKDSPAFEKIAAIVSEGAEIPSNRSHVLEIDDVQERYLRDKVKKVQWQKGAFEAVEIHQWMSVFDEVAGTVAPYELRDLSWSTFELSPVS